MRKKFNKKYPSVFVEDAYHKVMLPNGLVLPHLIEVQTKCSAGFTKLMFEILVDGEHKENSSYASVFKLNNTVVLRLPCGYECGFLKESCCIIEDDNFIRLHVELQNVNIVSSKLKAFELYELQRGVWG